MKSHVLTIRFHYAENDPRFEWRLEYFKKEVLPRILKQTDQNFDIAIRCNPKHAEIFKKLSPKIITFQTKNDEARYKTGKNGKKYFEDFVQWEDVRGLKKYDIQSGLDSDDLIGPRYIEAIQEALAGEKEATHICFQPQTFNLKTKRIKPMMRYHGTRGSAFMSLYQPNKENYKFIYCGSHISLWKNAKKSITLPQGHCWATIHDINESTGVKRT